MVHIEGILGLGIHIYSDQECIFVIHIPLYSDQESISWLIYSHILDQLQSTQQKILQTTYNTCTSQLFIKRHTMLSSCYLVYMTSSIAHSCNREVICTCGQYSIVPNKYRSPPATLRAESCSNIRNCSDVLSLQRYL